MPKREIYEVKLQNPMSERVGRRDNDSIYFVTDLTMAKALFYFHWESNQTNQDALEAGSG